jgi:hypothetical protein
VALRGHPLLLRAVSNLNETGEEGGGHGVPPLQILQTERCITT